MSRGPSSIEIDLDVAHAPAGLRPFGAAAAVTGGARAAIHIAITREERST